MPKIVSKNILDNEDYHHKYHQDCKSSQLRLTYKLSCNKFKLRISNCRFLTKA